MNATAARAFALLTLIALGVGTTAALGQSPEASAPSTSALACAAGAGDLAASSSMPKWDGWGADLSQSRAQTPGDARLSAADVPKLKLKWAFGFAGATQAYGQPAVLGGRVFVGSQNGHVYALNAGTGCTAWDVKAASGVRTAVSFGRIGTRTVAYFGDQAAHVYAVDASSGALVWTIDADPHPAAVITGSLTLAGGRLYVPVSSKEEGLAANPHYPCCSFRGSLLALDAATGKTLWKTYTVAHGSGGAVWSAPALDADRRIVYVATGDSYRDPAANTTDAVLAIDAVRGNLLWSRQLTIGDAYNLACGLPAPYDANCPNPKGPDFDFGSSPILKTFPDGSQVLVAAQKSGIVYGLDPKHGGAILWQTRVGRGSTLGGVQWGPAADSRSAYVAVSDVRLAPVAAGTAGAQATAFGASLLLDPSSGGGISSLDLRTGAVRWTTANPGCDGRAGCSPAQSAAVTAIPGIVFSGGLDGHVRAYATADGSIVWDVDTERTYATVNGVGATGGSLDGPGAAVAGGIVYVNSGYAFLGAAPGNVLLAFSVDGK